jgi:hypothetical protein
MKEGLKMWERVQSLPNEPGQMVSVQWARGMMIRFGPQSGKVALIPEGLIGSSAREITASQSKDGVPVVWRFIRGFKSGGDDLSRSPAWREERVEVPAGADVIETLEEELGVFDERGDAKWFVYRFAQAEIVDPGTV